MRRGMQAPVQWSAIATLVVACVVATAIRGLAQPPDAESDESIRVARINDAKSRPAAAVQARQLLPAFQRPPFDPAAVAMHDGGGFIVRVGEFLARSDLGVQTRALNEAFAEGWKNAFPAADPIAWPLQDIEHIAGDFNLIVKRMENPPDENHPNTVMLGTNCVVIRWKKPLGGQYQTLAQFPGAVEKEHDGKKYVELPVIPILGPSKPCVCQLDDHTLLGGFSEAGLQRRLDRLSAGAARPSWHKSWLAVEGGVMTVVALDSQIVRPLGGPADNDVEKLAHDLVTHVRQYAVGVEWCEPAVGASVIKARLGCETKEAAELVRSSLQGLVDQAMSELRRVAEADGEGAKIASSYLKPLREAKLEIHQVDEGWQVALELSGNVDVQALWKP